MNYFNEKSYCLFKFFSNLLYIIILYQMEKTSFTLILTTFKHLNKIINIVLTQYLKTEFNNDKQKLYNHINTFKILQNTKIL